MSAHECDADGCTRAPVGLFAEDLGLVTRTRRLCGRCRNRLADHRPVAPVTRGESA